MCVEDVSADHELFGQAVLRTCPGCKLVEAATPEEALAALNGGQQPHAIITDLVFPLEGMTGTDFITQVRRGYPRVPVIVLFGHSDAHTVARAYEAGVSAFFAKPATFEQLMRVVSVIAVFLETAVLPDS